MHLSRAVKGNKVGEIESIRNVKMEARRV